MPFDAATIPNETLRNLIAVRELLSDPAHWTRRTIARNRDGNAVGPCTEEATAFCLAGAWMRVIGLKIENDLTRFSSLTHALGFDDVPKITWWNDHLADHGTLLARLDAAIEKEAANAV